MSEANLPAVTEQDLKNSGLPSTMEMSPGLAIFFNDALYTRCKAIASHMANAEGMMPRHLLKKPEACFAVVSRAIVWKLDPFAVAMSTYQTPSGSIGYEGKLIQAILERSGQIEGPITFTHNGDWSKVKNKFRLMDGKSGGKYPVPTWGPAEAEGLSVTVSAQIRGESTPRTLDMDLISCFPLNSPLWATDPKRQICYTSVRAFGNIAVPALLMGIPFDIDPGALGDPMVDITPAKPTKSEFERTVRDDPKHQEFTARLNYVDAEEAVNEVRRNGLKELSPDIHDRWNEQCNTRIGQIRAKNASKQEPEQQQATTETVAEQQQEQATEQAAETTNPVPSDDDYKTMWGEKLAATKDVKDVGDLRAEGLNALPTHLHLEWNTACDARSKAIAEKPRGRKPAAAKPAQNGDKPGEEGVLGRGRRLLAGSLIKTADDVEDLEKTIADEINGADLIEWRQMCADKIASLTA